MKSIVFVKSSDLFEDYPNALDSLKESGMIYVGEYEHTLIRCAKLILLLEDMHCDNVNTDADTSAMIGILKLKDHDLLIDLES